jgi:hypothetical protein
MISIAIIVIIISLIVLMFARNCVPQPSGKLLTRWMSISYIFIAVFSIILLYVFFEASYFGTKNVVLTQTILSFLFGIGFLSLGIVVTTTRKAGKCLWQKDPQTVFLSHFSHFLLEFSSSQ